MRIAISNIAWDIAEDATIAPLLAKHQVDAIDIAPGKYFPEPSNASETEMARVRAWWADRGIAITGMQALLFGTTGLNVFGSDEARAAMLTHLGAVCRIGAGVGATRLVFGSPKNRDRGTLDDETVMAIAVPFFRQLGDIAASHGVLFCLEPNPPCYGANFMTTSDETAAVVRAVDHPAVRMQFDTGALTINGETPADVLRDHAPLIGHVHASEPNLVPLGDGLTDHGGMSAALSASLPDHIVSIEMVATAGEPHPTSVERALSIATRHYRPATTGQRA
ncbi:sugar phosphate isomerase/epimerase [Cupriavidus respiraculi]|uniref:sugar phosphate isomerase/epimerase family protein n=1 Tax=Cupriavidus respiraculi TaxID=195930 RepID=UPI001C93AFDB|nr:sugar phosphate isomerase/epimerase family protein [Cupriavidus respiraculi]MBY4949073.1 sugar phosphate isomerase/epimerase [Cupriavidus respiraculi]